MYVWLLKRTVVIALACGLVASAHAQEDTHAAPPGHGAAQPADHAGDAATALHEGAADAAHGEGASHEPDPFSGGIGNAILTLLIFGVVVIVLGKKAWPPLIKVLDEREHSIRGALEEAKKEREEAEKLLAQYKEQIDRARQEATAIVEEGRRDADVVRRRIQEEARADADQTLERAKREIQLAADAAIKDLYDRTADLAVDVASGIIRKELSAADHQGLVTESLERMKNDGARLN